VDEPVFLRGIAVARIFWDTNLFIYLFEEKKPFIEKVAALRQRMLQRGDQLFTSSLSVGEILTLPVRLGMSQVERRYLGFFNSGTISVITFDTPAAVNFARIRQDRSIRPPDAIQLACAATAKINLFITNDERLSQANVGGIDFITSLERAPI
jgi:uncharacterized protein